MSINPCLTVASSLAYFLWKPYAANLLLYQQVRNSGGFCLEVQTVIACFINLLTGSYLASGFLSHPRYDPSTS